MAGRERRVERGRMAVCAFVLTLSVLIAGGVYLTASPGDPASDAGLAPQRALTADAAHAPDVAAAPIVSGVGEASTAPVAPEPGAPDSVASAPMGSAYTTDADVPVQVYGGEEPGNADQATGYIVSQNDPAAPQSPTGTGDQTGTARGLDVRVTSPQTSIDESSPSHSSTGQSANAYDAVNDSTGAAYAQDGTNASDHG